MLLLVVSWIIATHFSGASPSSIYASYSASKIVQPELYLTPVDTPVITPVLKKLHWLHVEQCMVFKTATLVYKFLHTGILLHIFLPTPVLRVPGTDKVMTISFSFQSSTLLLNLSSSLVIVLLPLFGMLFQMRFMPVHPWPLSESNVKPTCTPKHTHLSLDHPPGILHGA